MKGRVFKIEISKVSSSALAAEICTGQHNRLLRRQHCSSLCSQSEGHEHVANMTIALAHDFVGFSARAWPPQYSPPSLCEQSELQCFASDLRRMSARCPLQGQRRNCHVIWLNTAQRFFYILNTLFIRIVLSLLTAYRSAENIFSNQSYKGCRQTGTYAFQRIWEQRRPNLGAETNAAGTRFAIKSGSCIFPLAALWTEMGSCLVSSKQCSVYKE